MLGGLGLRARQLTGYAGSALIGFLAAGVGAILRTLQDKNRDVVSVKDYGADPAASAATNSTAFTNAETASNYIYVPEGTYALTSLPDLTNFFGPGIISVGGALHYVADITRVAGGENILQNSAFQICSGLALVTKMNLESTGTHGAIVIASYTTAANLVTCLCANTGQLKNDDLVTFSAAADANLRGCAMRVSAVIANVSFQVRLPFGTTAAASAACTATLVTPGDYTASTGAGPDGTQKTNATLMWIDDHSVNLLTGTKRAVGLQKSGAGQETFRWVFSAGDLVKFRGKRVSFGLPVYHKIKGGAGTFRVFVNDGAVTYSPSGVSAGAYEITRVHNVLVGPTATTFEIGLSMDGAAGDVYHIGAQPHAIVGRYIPYGHYSPIPREILIPTVKISPVLWVGGAMTFPAVNDGTANSFSFEVDFFQESNGTIAPDVKALDALIEGIDDSGAVPVGSALMRAIAFRDALVAPIKYGPICVQTVRNVKSFASAPIFLDANGKARAYSAVASDAWTNVSMDINRFQLN